MAHKDNIKVAYTPVDSIEGWEIFFSFRKGNYLLEVTKRDDTDIKWNRTTCSAFYSYTVGDFGEFNQCPADITYIKM